MKAGDRIIVINKNHPRWMTCGVINEFKDNIYEVNMDYKNELEFFNEDEIEVKEVISKDQIEGKWLWGQNTRMFVVKEDSEPNFYIVEEPGSPWGPRPIHYDLLKYSTIIDESFELDPVYCKESTYVGVCDCCHGYKHGKPYIEVGVRANVNRWDADKIEEQLNAFFKIHAPHLKAELSATTFEGRDNPNFSVKLLDLSDIKPLS